MTAARGRVLVVDDDDGVLTAARLLLKRHVALVQTESDPEHIPALLADGFDVVLLDMNFALGANTGAEGFAWLERILRVDPAIVVVLMTAYGDVATAVSAIKAGATDFIEKPWQNEKLLATVSAALALNDSRDEVARLRSRQREILHVPGTGDTEIIGSSPAMQSVLGMVRRAAPTDANVLISGENGTGKEVIARTIHQQSRRADEVFLSVDLGAVSETLFESELFGHRKGAFTDARDDRLGRFQAASGGTLFLDEIGNLPLHLQAKLLRVLEARAVTPVGTDHTVPVDVRLICATNASLTDLCRDGGFREDLLYRINTVEIRIPPLRERPEDIPPLVDLFLDHYARKYNLAPKRLSPGTLKRLQAHTWPGNIRELRHAVERALIMSDSPQLGSSDFFLATAARPRESALAGHSLESMEQQAVRQALTNHGGNVSRAAKELGISRASLYRRMEKYGL